MPRNSLAFPPQSEDSVLVPIDHRPRQLANVGRHDLTMLEYNKIGLTTAARPFYVPILTGKVADRIARIFPEITDVVLRE